VYGEQSIAKHYGTAPENRPTADRKGRIGKFWRIKNGDWYEPCSLTLVLRQVYTDSHWERFAGTHWERWNEVEKRWEQYVEQQWLFWTGEFYVTVVVVCDTTTVWVFAAWNNDWYEDCTTDSLTIDDASLASDDPESYGNNLDEFYTYPENYELIDE
jgi:hypothetical protein